MPVIQFFTDKQKGENFAERITHAVEMGFAAGIENLIITGTDSPAVNCNQFKGVAKKLNNNNLILAPSKDGGVYIIGLQRKCFQQSAFKSIPWQSNNVFDALKKLAEQNELSLCIEVSACDIDIAGELLSLRSNFCNSWFGIFASQLLQLFSTSHLPVFNTVLFIPAFGSTSSLRGPPVMLAV